MVAILIRAVLVVPALVCVGILVCYFYISVSTRAFLYSSVDSVPETETGLVLGTSRYLVSGAPNPYFDYRIRAAAALYQAGKIRYILASGDNSKRSYNEPRIMREELIRNGVPPDVIYLDFAGFRTLDSVVRGNRIFGQNGFLIISQRFHNERAVYLSRRFGIDAFAFNADDVKGMHGLRTHLREFLARVAAVIDVNILHRQPKFLGDMIQIGD